MSTFCLAPRPAFRDDDVNSTAQELMSQFLNHAAVQNHRSAAGCFQTGHPILKSKHRRGISGRSPDLGRMKPTVASVGSIASDTAHSFKRRRCTQHVKTSQDSRYSLSLKSGLQHWRDVQENESSKSDSCDLAIQSSVTCTAAQTSLRIQCRDHTTLTHKRFSSSHW